MECGRESGEERKGERAWINGREGACFSLTGQRWKGRYGGIQKAKRI